MTRESHAGVRGGPFAMTPPHVAVVIPCFNVAARVGAVIDQIPTLVRTIVAVDDASTDDTGAVLARHPDPRLLRVTHERNQGVGGAVLTGYRTALAAGADICVKIDGDGQMDAGLLPQLLQPLLAGEADYAKGNRLRDFGALDSMPRLRLFGNSALSFLTKLVSGYWRMLDPTNGYTAITAPTLRLLNLARVSRRYFFETSMLVELSVVDAVVRDVDMPARYLGEESSLRISRVIGEFPPLLLRSLLRRFVWRYVLRDFNAMTVCVLTGVPSVAFGVTFGAYHWWRSVATGVPATAGTTFVAALPIIIGVQCLLVALVLDMLYQPSVPLTKRLGARLPASDGLAAFPSQPTRTAVETGTSRKQG